MIPESQKDIPRGKDLCEELGFSPGSGRQQSKLLESAHSWRRTYRTSRGTLGKDLIDWKSASIRKELETLVGDYLEKGLFGTKFWPATGVPSPRLVPEYPKDRELIVSNLTQLVWRQNTNEARNSIYYQSPKRNQEGTHDSQSSTNQTSPPSTVTSSADHCIFPVPSLPPYSNLNTIRLSEKPASLVNDKTPQTHAFHSHKGKGDQLPRKKQAIQDSQPALLLDERSVKVRIVKIPKKASRKESSHSIYEYVGSEDESVTKPRKLLAIFTCGSSLVHQYKLEDERQTQKGQAAQRAPIANMISSEYSTPPAQSRQETLKQYAMNVGHRPTKTQNRGGSTASPSTEQHIVDETFNTGRNANGEAYRAETRSTETSPNNNHELNNESTDVRLSNDSDLASVTIAVERPLKKRKTQHDVRGTETAPLPNQTHENLAVPASAKTLSSAMQELREIEKEIERKRQRLESQEIPTTDTTVTQELDHSPFASTQSSIDRFGSDQRILLPSLPDDRESSNDAKNAGKAVGAEPASAPTSVPEEAEESGQGHSNQEPYMPSSATNELTHMSNADFTWLPTITHADLQPQPATVKPPASTLYPSHSSLTNQRQSYGTGQMLPPHSYDQRTFMNALGVPLAPNANGNQQTNTQTKQNLRGQQPLAATGLNQPYHYHTTYSQANHNQPPLTQAIYDQTIYYQHKQNQPTHIPTQMMSANHVPREQRRKNHTGMAYATPHMTQVQPHIPHTPPHTIVGQGISAFRNEQVKRDVSSSRSTNNHSSSTDALVPQMANITQSIVTQDPPKSGSPPAKPPTIDGDSGGVSPATQQSHRGGQGVEVKIVIVKARYPYQDNLVWEVQNLASKTLESVFDEIGSMIGKRNFQMLHFRLATSRVREEVRVAQGRGERYSSMMKDFKNLMIQDFRSNADNRKFLIEIEPILDEKMSVNIGGETVDVDFEADFEF